MPELFHLPSWVGPTVVVIVVMFGFDKLIDVLRKIEQNTRNKRS